MRILTRTITSAFCIILALQSYSQFYTGSQQEFGKNRVQYRSFNWLYYPYKQFEVYYYQGGTDLAEYTLQSADAGLERVEKFFDYPLEDKLQIIVYNKQSEFRQSNIGLVGDEQYNIGGSTRIVGSKMFIYFEDSRQQLDEQIQQGLASVLFNQMMYGGDWKDVVKNSTLLTIPEWYEKGIISYISTPWDGETESYVRDGVMTGKYDKFNRLEGDQAIYAGHAMWKYIADVYGENVIPNILYMTRISRNIESGFLFVLGVSLNSLTDDYLEYYEDYYKARDKQKEQPDLKLELTAKHSRKYTSLNNQYEPGSKEQRKKMKALGKLLGELPVKHKSKYQYSQFKMSPDQSKVAFVTNQMGQYKVWMYDFDSGKLKKIYKREYKLERIVDDSYPILAWHPTSGVLTFIFEKKGRAFIANYNVAEKKVREKELFRIDKVVDLQYAPDGRKMIFSGVREGQSDLYLYQVIGNNQQQLTFDPYDDLYPRFLPDGSSIIFSSNRPDDTLRREVPNELFNLNKDIFVYKPNSTILERVTSTPGVDETHPFAYDDRNFTYLSDGTGIANRYIANIDSTISRVDTIVHYRYFTVSNPVSNYAISPLEYDFNHKTGAYSLVFYDGRRFQFYADNRSLDQVNASIPGGSSSGNTTRINEQEVLVVPKEESKGEVDIYDYKFEDEELDYEYEKESVRIDEIDSSGKPIDEADSTVQFVLPKSRNYRLNFATDYVLSQIDNSFANQFYQSFTGPTSVSPGISGLVKLGISDLFEDYKIVGGFRLSGNLENNDYGLSFTNLSGRLDRTTTFQRQGLQRISGFSIIKLHTHSLQYKVKWPFNELTSISATGLWRNDRSVFLSTDPQNLREPNLNENNFGAKLEFVFDNTISKGLNLYNGTRYKLWAEYYQEPTIDQSDFMVLGADFRHYQKIHRDLIMAFRVAASTSLGSRKLVYYLGGVDNWLFQRVDTEAEISPNQNYRYQALATPMRGFWVNSRNGNSMAVASAEVRWPVFKYLLNKPIKSDFVENFQIVGFADAGSAWTGPHPYSNENEFNTQVIDSNPITVTIENNREPVIYGYGFGLRSRLLGYFVRADWSWGVDDGVVLPRVFYLSLNLDF